MDTLPNEVKYTLPDEVKYKILSYVPKSLLKKHFDDPVIGPWCMTLYYSTISIDTRPDGLSNLPNDSRLGELRNRKLAIRHSIFGSEYPTPRFSSAHFQIFEFFLDLVRANSEVNFNRLEINSIELFLRLARDHPDVLAAMKQIELRFSYHFKKGEDYWSYDGFCNLVQKVARDADEVGIPSTVTELDFNFPFKIEDRELALEYSQFMPATADLSRLTVLSISYATVVDLEQLLARTTCLREVSFYNVAIYDHQLQYLPRGLKRLSLWSSLRLTETHVRLQLPESLQFFEVSTTTCLGDNSIPVTLDMSHLHQLVGVSVNRCHIRSLEDLKLPWTIRYLNIVGCPELRDLKSFHLFKNLVSFTCDWCHRLTGQPAVFRFPPSLEYFNLKHSIPANQIETEDPTPKEWETFYVVETEGYTTKRYLKLDGRTVWPNSVRQIHVDNPNLVLDWSHRFPDSLTKLTLQVHHVLDIHKLVLPKQLQELSLRYLEIDILDGLQFPASLKTFDTSFCKIRSLKRTNLRSLPDLEVLNLECNSLDDSSEVFKELPASLKHFNINGKFTQLDVSGCPQLKELSIFRCNLKSISQESLNLPDSLERLSVVFNSMGHISDSFEFPVNLKRLSLDTCGIKIDETFFAKLPAGLEDLDTSGCDSSGRETEPYEVAQLKFPRGLKSLRFNHRIDLAESPNFTDQCPGLESLYFAVHTYPRLDFRTYPTGLLKVYVSADVYGEVVGDIDHLEKMTSFRMDNWKRKCRKLSIPVNTQNFTLRYSGIDILVDHIDYSKCKSLVHLGVVENFPPRDVLVETAKSIKGVCPTFSGVSIDDKMWTQQATDQMRAFGVTLTPDTGD